MIYVILLCSVLYKKTLFNLVTCTSIETKFFINCITSYTVLIQIFSHSGSKDQEGNKGLTHTQKKERDAEV